MSDANELAATNSGEGRSVCSKRLELLRQWTQALTAMVEVTTELAHVTQNTRDFARHQELMKKALLLHEDALAAKNAFHDHCAQHGCAGKLDMSRVM